MQRILLITLTLMLMLAGCTAAPPIPVFVTPTPEQAAPASTSTPVPTVVAEAAAATSTITTLPPTNTTAVESTTETTPVEMTPRGGVARTPGPIIGPDYTPPPTQTPRPTTTPTTGPSPTPSPTLPPTETLPPSETPVPPTPSGPQPTALPFIDPQPIGVQVHAFLDQEDWNHVVGMVDQLGVGWVKVQIDWDLMQPNGPDEISVDFRRQELYLEDLSRRGFNVLVSVAKAPAWARSTTDESGPPDDPQALVGFLNLMLNEFGNVIDAVEVWNEPNLRREWQGQSLDGGTYMRYFVPAYEAINAYSQRMFTDPLEPRAEAIIVLTAGLAPTSTTEFSTDDRVYLEQMYNAGLANYPDVVVAMHPFGWGNPPDSRCCNNIEGRGWDDDPHFFFLDTIEAYREMMVRYGHGGAQLWATEFGWGTWDSLPGEPPDGWMAYNDKWAQANHTLRTFQIAEATDYIGVMILWNMNFAILPGLVENRDERASYSLLVPMDPAERPLYWMIYDAVQPDVDLPRYD